MFIDLLEIKGKYRGVNRSQNPYEPVTWRRKNWEKISALGDRYYAWELKSNNVYSDSGLELLKELRDALNNKKEKCEIVLFSDEPSEFHLGDGFLGFDIYDHNEALSCLETPPEEYKSKLNENDLFANFEDASEYYEKCIAPKIADNPDPDKFHPHPFCVWLYKE